MEPDGMLKGSNIKLLIRRAAIIAYVKEIIFFMSLLEFFFSLKKVFFILEFYYKKS
tara:strand:+ start:1893 stop:2060 length:168 start_codon:yes stop_codon:yes gene_type:complete